MIKCNKCEIEIDESETRRHARIQPKGFWTSVVNVSQRQKNGTWEEPEVSWGAGGTDGTLTGNALVDSFIEALNHAKAIADSWS